MLERQKRLREEREREEEKEPETPFQRMLADRAKRLEKVELKPESKLKSETEPKPH